MLTKKGLKNLPSLNRPTLLKINVRYPNSCPQIQSFGPQRLSRIQNFIGSRQESGSRCIGQRLGENLTNDWMLLVRVKNACKAAHHTLGTEIRELAAREELSVRQLLERAFYEWIKATGISEDSIPDRIADISGRHFQSLKGFLDREPELRDESLLALLILLPEWYSYPRSKMLRNKRVSSPGSDPELRAD
jgi:hypothetical protein